MTLAVDETYLRGMREGAAEGALPVPWAWRSTDFTREWHKMCHFAGG